MAQVVRQPAREAQLALIRAHPELAGKAMVSQSLTAESTNEQSKAGLTHCTPEEFARNCSSSTPTTTPNLAGPSSWPCAARAARGLSRADHRHLCAPPGQPPRL
jgi:hypothetical protein